MNKRFLEIALEKAKRSPAELELYFLALRNSGKTAEIEEVKKNPFIKKAVELSEARKKEAVQKAKEREDNKDVRGKGMNDEMEERFKELREVQKARAKAKRRTPEEIRGIKQRQNEIEERERIKKQPRESIGLSLKRRVKRY